MELNWADFAIIGIIFLSAFISVIRGFIREAISLATWVFAIWASLRYTLLVSSYLTEAINLTTLRIGTAALIIFISVLIVGAVINYIVGQLIEKTRFSGTDRTLGAVFGMLRGALIVAIIIVLASLTPIPQEPWWKQSAFLPVLQEKIMVYKVYLPEQISGNPGFTHGAMTADPEAIPQPAPVPAAQQPAESAPATRI